MNKYIFLFHTFSTNFLINFVGKKWYKLSESKVINWKQLSRFLHTSDCGPFVKKWISKLDIKKLGILPESLIEEGRFDKKRNYRYQGNIYFDNENEKESKILKLLKKDKIDNKCILKLENLSDDFYSNLFKKEYENIINLTSDLLKNKQFNNKFLSKIIDIDDFNDGNIRWICEYQLLSPENIKKILNKVFQINDYYGWNMENIIKNLYKYQLLTSTQKLELQKHKKFEEMEKCNPTKIKKLKKKY